MKKPTPARPLFALEWHSTRPLYEAVKRPCFLPTSPIPITSHTNLVSLSSSSVYFICSALSIVLTLYIALLFDPEILTIPQHVAFFLSEPHPSTPGGIGLWLFITFHADVVSLTFHPGQCPCGNYH